MDAVERLARNVRRLRRAADYTQEAFADMVGVTRSYLSDVERGTRNPTVKLIEKMAEALDVSVGSLFD